MTEDKQYINYMTKPAIFEEGNLTKSFIPVKEDILKYMERDFVNEIINNIDAPKYKLICLFMWMTGCRVTEVINIRKRDLDFNNQIMTIRWLKNRKYLYRNVPIHPNLNQLLSMITAGYGLDKLIFPYSRQRVWQIVKKYFPKWVHPHTFRHSFAINYLRQADTPNDLVILRKLMGHSSILTTMAYLDVVPVDQAKQLAKIKF